MNKKRLILYSFLAVNTIAVLFIIVFWSDNTFVNILLATYLLILAPFIYYAANKQK